METGLLPAAAEATVMTSRIDASSVSLTVASSGIAPTVSPDAMRITAPAVVSEVTTVMSAVAATTAGITAEKAAG